MVTLHLLFRLLIQIIWFPVDLFRFTYHCWLYTFSMIHFRWFLKYEEEPCIFCRGGEVGETRCLNSRIKYHNMWMVKLLNPDINFTPSNKRLRPVMTCDREGGYRKSPTWIPWAAVILGGAWFCALGAGIWCSEVIPQDLQQEAKARIFFWSSGN